MALNEIWQELSQYSMPEIIAVLASLSYVILATREHRAVQIPRQGTSGHWGDLGSRSSRIRRPGGARQLNSGRAFGRNKTLPDLQAIVIDQELNQTRSQTLKP